jgi:hypothetical protein
MMGDPSFSETATMFSSPSRKTLTQPMPKHALRGTLAQEIRAKSKDYSIKEFIHVLVQSEKFQSK